MLVSLLLVVARREAGRQLLGRLADQCVLASVIEEALALEVAEAIAVGCVAVMPPLLEPRVTVALLRLLAVADAHADDLPDHLAELVADCRACAGEWGVKLPRLAA